VANASFRQLPIDGLISTWKSKLPASVSEAYVQMGRIIADRDLNLAALFDELVSTAALASAGTLYLGDPNTDGSWRLTISGSNLSVQKRESATWTCWPSPRSPRPPR
jgi:hypothetical protein